MLSFKYHMLQSTAQAAHSLASAQMGCPASWPPQTATSEPPRLRASPDRTPKCGSFELTGSAQAPDPGPGQAGNRPKCDGMIWSVMVCKVMQRCIVSCDIMSTYLMLCNVMYASRSATRMLLQTHVPEERMMRPLAPWRRASRSPRRSYCQA